MEILTQVKDIAYNPQNYGLNPAVFVGLYITSHILWLASACLLAAGFKIAKQKKEKIWRNRVFKYGIAVFIASHLPHNAYSILCCRSLPAFIYAGVIFLLLLTALISIYFKLKKIRKNLDSL